MIFWKIVILKICFSSVENKVCGKSHFPENLNLKKSVVEKNVLLEGNQIPLKYFHYIFV